MIRINADSKVPQQIQLRQGLTTYSYYGVLVGAALRDTNFTDKSLLVTFKLIPIPQTPIEDEAFTIDTAANYFRDSQSLPKEEIGWIGRTEV